MKHLSYEDTGRRDSHHFLLRLKIYLKYYKALLSFFAGLTAGPNFLRDTRGDRG